MALKRRIGKLDAEVRDRFLTLPEAPIILSLPGMSHRTGPRFLAEVGTLARFSSPDACRVVATMSSIGVVDDVSPSLTPRSTPDRHLSLPDNVRHWT